MNAFFIYWPLGLLSLVSSVLMIAAYRVWALKRNWLDEPNHRSSHQRAVPSGAGLVLLFCYGSLLFYWWMTSSMAGEQLVFWLCPLLMGLLGALDDRHNLSRRWRVLVYAVLVILALYVFSLDQLSASLFSTGLWPNEVPWAHLNGFKAISLLVVAVSLVWLVNLYNFMDGINGIAGFEVLFVVIAYSVLTSGLSESHAMMVVVMMGAIVGFLLWNFPVAKVFMGDAGSVLLGAWLGLLALSSDLTIWVWGILLAVFIVDATYTLTVRMLRGDRWYEAHRVHAFQILSRRLQSHSKTVGWVMGVNLLWLLPLAYGANNVSQYGPLLLLLAWLPLLIVAYWLKAGVPEAVAGAHS